jgi:hypothetical protein
VALTHTSECDVTYVLKEPRRRSKCVNSEGMTCPIAFRSREIHIREMISEVMTSFADSVDVITELCIGAAYRISSSGSSLLRAFSSTILYQKYQQRTVLQRPMAVRDIELLIPIRPEGRIQCHVSKLYVIGK